MHTSILVGHLPILRLGIIILDNYWCIGKYIYLLEDRCSRFRWTCVCVWYIPDESYLLSFFFSCKGFTLVLHCADATSKDNIVFSFKIFLGNQSHEIWTKNCFRDLPCHHQRVTVWTICTCVDPLALVHHISQYTDRVGLFSAGFNGTLMRLIALDVFVTCYL